jgi:hypothetical protein
MDLLAEIREILNRISSKILEAMFIEWEKRLQTCIDTGGDFVESIIVYIKIYVRQGHRCKLQTEHPESSMNDQKPMRKILCQRLVGTGRRSKLERFFTFMINGSFLFSSALFSDSNKRDN